jgi:membrane protease YdiL (CAAX protease family)
MVPGRLPISPGWIVALSGYYLAAVTVTHHDKLAGAAALLAGLGIFARPLARLLSRGLLDPWRALNRATVEVRAAQPADHFDYRPLVVMCTVAVSLTLIEYYGDRDVFELAVRRFAPAFAQTRYYELAGFAYWSLARMTGYVLIPRVVVLFMPRERFRDYGLSVRGFIRHIWIYGLLYLVVLPAVIMVSFTQPFQHTYPFYKLASRSWTDFLSWETFYALQFFALEVFFRGFMLHSLRRAMGAYAIFAMAVPYCMIHYHKPIAEVLGAVAAGVVLGTLSLHTGSIWCGVLIHVSVAVTMDSLALAQTVGLPGNARFVLRA